MSSQYTAPMGSQPVKPEMSGPASLVDHATKTRDASAYSRIFEKVCEQLNFNEREREWFRQLLKEELQNH